MLGRKQKYAINIGPFWKGLDTPFSVQSREMPFVVLCDLGKLDCNSVKACSDLPAHVHHFFSQKPRLHLQTRILLQKEVKAILSEKVTLSCEMSDAQTEVKWYKEGKLLSSSRKIHVESKGKNRQLVFDSVEKRDAGEYTCEAGAEKLVFKIQVEGREGLFCCLPLVGLPFSLVFEAAISVGSFQC